MPIISKVEGKSWRGRLNYAILMLVLSAGALTMLYPFVIMVSGTVRSEMDETDLDIIPAYFVDDDVLYRKLLETKYNYLVEQLNRAHGTASFSFKSTDVPATYVPRRADDFRQFLEESEPPQHWQLLGGTAGTKTVPEYLRALTERLRTRYDGDIAAFSRDIGGTMANWDFRAFRPPDWLTKRYDYQPNPIYEELFALTDESPWAWRQILSISGYFVETMIQPTYGRRDVKPYNDKHAVAVDTFDNFVLPQHVPGEDQPRLRREWIEYITKELNPSFVALRDVPNSLYHDYLRQRYDDDIASLNKVWNRDYSMFDQIELPRGRWLGGAERTDYVEFLGQTTTDGDGNEHVVIPYERYELIGPEYAWRQWLRRHYSSIAALNDAHEANHTSFDAVPMPVEQLEMQYTLTEGNSLRIAFATRNFINVFDELLVRGRAFMNTAIYCLLSIVIALLINPLAAYAMSRFRLPGTYKFLLVLMATMSFPPMVTLIPQFIMLREMSMLNTFWALILPAAANGYLIFLLKGFFDSLPADLYDAALIDGAGEFRMFFQITMSLSKPILAVVALQAFNGAYVAFLYPLIVCPDESMWLLNVWLMQYQQQVSMGGMFAAVLVAAVPPLVVFIFAQNIIMRGIVVPVEK
jgi:multiple sugar transport system permease protein